MIVPTAWRRRLPLTLILALAGGLLGLYAYWVGRAPSAQSPTGDAVIVHAGHGDRLTHGRQLMAEGAAPTLVVMLGESWPGGLDADDGVPGCGASEPYEVVCPRADPETTIGEARALRTLVAERGWSEVVVVTSDYHLRRATFLDRRCAEVDVIGSGSGEGRGVFGTALSISFGDDRDDPGRARPLLSGRPTALALSAERYVGVVLA